MHGTGTKLVHRITESHVPRNKGCMVYGGGTVLEGVAESMAVMVEGGAVVEGVCRQ